MTRGAASIDGSLIPEEQLSRYASNAFFLPAPRTISSVCKRKALYAACHESGWTGPDLPDDRNPACDSIASRLLAGGAIRVADQKIRRARSDSMRELASPSHCMGLGNHGPYAPDERCEVLLSRQRQGRFQRRRQATFFHATAISSTSFPRSTATWYARSCSGITATSGWSGSMTRATSQNNPRLGDHRVVVEFTDWQLGR